MTSLDRTDNLSRREAAIPGEVRRWRAFPLLAIAFFMTVIDGKTVYVVDANPFGASGSVIPIRVATNTAGKPITVGRFPFDIAIAP